VDPGLEARLLEAEELEARGEARAELLPPHPARAGAPRLAVAEAEDVVEAARHERAAQALHVERRLVIVEGVEQTGVDHRVAGESEELEPERVAEEEATRGVAAGDRLGARHPHRTGRDVDPEGGQPLRAEVERVLAAAAACVEHQAADQAGRVELDEGGLRALDLPGGEPLVERLEPGLRVLRVACSAQGARRLLFVEGSAFSATAVRTGGRFSGSGSHRRTTEEAAHRRG